MNEIKYRKKPIVIDAFRMTYERRQNNVDWPEWLNLAWSKSHDDEGAIYPVNYPNSDGTDNLVIFTKEGCMQVDFGDWIIKGVKGELYPCKNDIFEATYEVV